MEKKKMAEGVDVSDLLTPEQFAASNENMKIEHIELRSQMTKDGKWFTTDFVTQNAYNPGFLPHPYKPETWVMFAQRDKSKDGDDIWNSELVCEAVYHEGSQTMKCIDPPIILPIASTFSDLCVGPHDARVFNGPNAPYIIYGSQGPAGSCLGQYIHDLRRLTPFLYNESSGSITHPNEAFFWPTDLHRPPPVGGVEKNWFAFWDMDDDMYLHYDVKPTKRSFAKVNTSDGSVGDDLAPLATTDDQCMKDLMPAYHHNDREWIHQATNSLSITLCKRADPTCHPTPDNTFIMLLFQTKTFYMHGVYYPYIMLFKRTAPFQIHGISAKPFWYSGRGRMNEFWRWSTWKPKDQTQMVFTTQMSWVGQGNMYHGFLDDRVILAFGIEDKHGGGLDVVAGDLLQGMRFCGGGEVG
ncbi:hypothetical protein M409DRAFT_69156 [Zasmidium cellare ATCC 36951]|uniref:Uncharacterized protein n=1 Tax=Zasmidium cellare ATCC 36951 TaxID=1080233 RepID=A0A6A6C988_ZASCE|nr:uncharacterized protein M409DRAFT_69156 [Zasmidium cellare ATCC 36951]KAF2162219.1 hypothetical protein M409DRAFT_69156 [Zasmidium cellare ATCC 36951]